MCANTLASKLAGTTNLVACSFESTRWSNSEGTLQLELTSLVFASVHFTSLLWNISLAYEIFSDLSVPFSIVIINNFAFTAFSISSTESNFRVSSTVRFAQNWSRIGKGERSNFPNEITWSFCTQYWFSGNLKLS